MKSFDEWFNENIDYLFTTKDSAKEAYKAGAQSQQQKIDELQKRIDISLEVIDQYTEVYGEDELILTVLKILKGEPK